MYHKISILDCAPQLMELTRIAGHAITFSLSNDSSITKDYQWDGTKQERLAKSLGHSFVNAYGGDCFLAAVKFRFIQYFETIHKPAVGEWLWKRYANIATPIVRLLCIPLDQKSGILAAFEKDIELEDLFTNTESTRLSYKEIADDCQDAKTWISTLFKNFYALLDNSGSISGEILNSERALNHQAILQSYLRTNSDLKVCPGCDGDPPRTITNPNALGDLRIYSNIDHFFPISLYPFFAVHPLNLVPMCSACNQERKRDKDVLQTPDAITFDDIYHPYFRGAHGEVEVVIEREQADEKPHLRIRPKDQNPRFGVRLRSIEYILDLQHFWDGDLQSGILEGHIAAHLYYVTQDERDRNEHHPNEWISKKLADIALCIGMTIRLQTRAVATQAYALWLATDSLAQEEIIPRLNKAQGTSMDETYTIHTKITPEPVP